MKSSAPWSVKGIERDARETAKEAAKRQGMTVGEWLNRVIYTAGDPSADPGGSDGEIEGLKLRDLVTAIEHLHKRLAETDVKNTDAIGELTRNIGGAVERLQLLERVKPAEGTYDDLTVRLEKLEKAGGDKQRIEALKALEKAVAQVAVQFDSAHKSSLERMNATERQLQDLTTRMDGLNEADSAAGTGVLKEAVNSLTARVADAERIAIEAATLKDVAFSATDPEFVERTGKRLRVLGDEIKRGGDHIRTMENALVKMSDRIEAAEKRSAEGVQKVAETVTALSQRIDAPSSDNAAPSINIEDAISSIRQETDERLSALHTSMRDIAGRLGGNDDTQSSAPAGHAQIEIAQENFNVGPKPSTDDAADENAAANFDVTAPLQSAPENDYSDALTTDNSDESVFGDGALFTPDESDTADSNPAESNYDEDDDPFAFEDEDFAASVEDTESLTPSSESKDEFAFDLDEEDSQDGPFAELKGDGFGDAETKERSDYREDPYSKARYAASTAESIIEEDLDDILDELDPVTPHTQESQATEKSATAKALLTGGAAEISTAPEPENRPENRPETRPENPNDRADISGNLADELNKDGEASELDGQIRPTRRNLTAKQKAILAARARQKRKASKAQYAEATTAPQPKKEAPSLADDAQKDEDEPATSLPGKLTGAINSIKARFTGKKPPEQNTGDLKKRISQAGGDGAEDNAPQSGLAGNRHAHNNDASNDTNMRPVTLALGGAIILALTALFFLVRDVMFTPNEVAPPAATAALSDRSNASPASPASSSPSSSPSSSTRAGAANEERPTVTPLEESASDIISPRNLYVASIAALNAADTPTQTRAAIRKLEEAAALGHPPAQLQLGELLKSGQGVEQDLDQAQTWFRRSANGGNVLAMHRLGILTANSDNGAPDIEEAVIWFEKAANYGLVDSQFNLGAIYHPVGEGGSPLQDAGNAYYWYSLATQNGDTEAAPLAAGIGNALGQDARQRIDAEVAAWRAEPMDPQANELAAG